MIKYTLSLRNPNPDLDLRTKRNQINEVLKYIENGGVTGRRFRDFQKCHKLEVEQRYILITVDESSTAWHRFVGRRLANIHGMRNYCDPDDETRMFKWKST